MSEAVRYSDTLSLRLSPEVSAAVAQVAAARLQRPAEWYRQAIRMGLALEGIDMTTRQVASGKAPEWALVQVGESDRIVNTWHGAKPDIGDSDYWPAGYEPGPHDAWVPIENVDTQPFDAARHWRLKPTMEVISVYATPTAVRRVYPVVPKSLEHA